MTQRFQLRKSIPKLVGESIVPLRPASRHLAVALAGGMLLLGVPWLQDPLISNASLLGGSGLLSYGVGRSVQQAKSSRQNANALPADAVALMMRDVSAVLVAQDTGAIVQMNSAATTLFFDVHPDQQGNLTQLFSKFTASPAALIARLTARAQASGSAHDEIITRDGAVRIVLYAQAGSDQKLWRIDSLAPTVGGGGGGGYAVYPHANCQ